ncbi:MAG: hypothetical protein OZ921_08850 [Sorangiineae bacterium]|nr:hypothetical protein [Polyangiaceae bacterium]MEB2322609.1 hypothetical protein [Sorangiineae bacterium]
MKLLGWGLLAATFAAAPSALAQDAGADGGPTVTPGAIIADYCADPELRCTLAPIAYEKTIQLPVAFDWDTDWIPSGSDLQVRFYVKVPADTTVRLNGQFVTEWPDPMTLSVLPGRNAFLGFDYGLEVGAKARIDTKILGIHITWTGDIPYVPQVDFHLKGGTLFDPWAFAPNGASASAFTQSLKLFDVNLLGLVGIPSQISKGGIALNVKGELRATYTTERMMIAPAGANETPITTEGGKVTRAFAGGGFVEYDVWPEGKVHYDGALHLIPSFFVEALGYRLDLPIFDFPITVPLGDQAFVFDPLTVHVPLPDIPPLADDIIDFGAVPIGGGKKKSVSLSDIGEATALATGFIDATTTDAFKLLSPSMTIDPGSTETIDVRFTPKQLGAFKTKLTLITNDPDNRFIEVTLRGTGVEEDSPDYPTDEEDAGAPLDDAGDGLAALSGDPAGCGCRAVAHDGAPLGGSLIALTGVALFTARRRTRGSRRHA